MRAASSRNRHPRRIRHVIAVRRNAQRTLDLDAKRRVDVMRIAVVTLAHVRKLDDARAQPGLFANLANRRLREQLTRPLPPAGKIPKRRCMILVSRRNQENATAALRQARREMHVNHAAPPR